MPGHDAPPASLFRAVERTMAVLRTMNEDNGATVGELARTTGIPRPSIYRIVETLCELGYLRQLPQDGRRYELTLLVRTLSDGFSDEPWVRGVAQPVMEALQREIVWPTDISTFFGNSMYLRSTTRRYSPLTIDTATAGLRLPMLLSASGQAYLAFCNDVEREAILANLRRSDAPEDELARDSRHVRSLVSITRKKGYGERHGEIFSKTGAIAVPIRRNGHVLACLSISFIASALTPREAAARYLPQLREAVRSIEIGCSTTTKRDAEGAASGPSVGDCRHTD